jgi:hypothetical protein
VDESERMRTLRRAAEVTRKMKQLHASPTKDACRNPCTPSRYQLRKTDAVYANESAYETRSEGICVCQSLVSRTPCAVVSTECARMVTVMVRMPRSARTRTHDDSMTTDDCVRNAQ